ncbi:benzoate 4-monooxygenase cytochrome P450 (BCL4p) [Colletotrichum tofieldiae]|uniref:Benzoate 4-monooxygenase cytochrome P450 (BCL4p) n=1 Tax=Colletotrichum tofieldiae TaxID=708197 RepID=A0A166U2X3_9PEZI|nr:benzoate 4-monooxygenase cytochrome P450 (BCL4p) [Colletotrichum tofieldiae]
MDMAEYNVTTSTPEPKAGWPAVERLLGAYTTPETWSWQVVAGCLATIILCRFVAVWSYNLWFHPLARFPGPLLGRCSLIFRFMHSSRGRIHSAIADAHKKYGMPSRPNDAARRVWLLTRRPGDIVRIAPNELSFASVESWKAIYGHPTGGRPIAPKGPFYEVFAAGFSSKCVGSERDPKKHSAMRKMLNPAFSQRGLLEQEEIISGIIDKFVSILGEKAGPGTKGLNMTKWYEMNSFDILGEMAFGESFHSLDTGVPHFWADIVLEHLYVITLFDNLRRIGWLAKLAGLLVPASIVTSNQNSNYSRQQVEKRLKTQESRNDFVSLLVDKVRAGEVSKEEMTAHVSTLTIAGGETVATTLSSITFFLAQNPEKFERLTKEIRAAFKSYKEINAVKAQQLPYLQAVINEGLRLFPPASNGASRVSPGFSLHGKYIPEGTEINVSPWSITHNPKYFSDPWDFKPERWLDPNSTDNRDANRPFLLGPRDCLGRNFALMELNLVLAKLLWSYDMELVNKEVNFLEQSTVHVLWWKPALFVRWHRPQSTSS